MCVRACVCVCVCVCVCFNLGNSHLVSSPVQAYYCTITENCTITSPRRIGGWNIRTIDEPHVDVSLSTLLCALPDI